MESISLIQRLLSQESTRQTLLKGNIEFNYKKVREVDEGIEKLDAFTNWYVGKTAIVSFCLSFLVSILILEVWDDKNTLQINNWKDYLSYGAVLLTLIVAMWERQLFGVKRKVFEVRKWKNDTVFLKVILTFITIIITIYLVILKRVDITENIREISGVWICPFIILLLVVFFFFFFLNIVYINRSKYNYHIEPRWSIAREISLIVKQLQKINETNCDRDINKKELVDRIKYTSYLIENCNKYLIKNDIEMRKAAISFENYCHWIYHPQNETFLNLEIEMLKKLKIVIDGEMHYLKDESIENPKSRKWWKNINIKIGEVFDLLKNIISIVKALV